MNQPLQANLSVTSIGASELLADIPPASNGQLPCNRVRGTMWDANEIKAMEAELHEYRYHCERKVKQRTAQLVKRISLLESCNATLCDKLALANKELVALKQSSAHSLPKNDTKPKDRTAKLFVMSNPALKLIGSNAQGNQGEHATAA